MDARRRAEPAGAGEAKPSWAAKACARRMEARASTAQSVQDGLGHLAERPVGAAHGMVAHEGVEVAGSGRGLLDDAGRLPGGGQVGRDVDEPGGADQVGADGVHDGIDVVGAPGLGGVVRAVVVGDDARPVVGGAAGDGVADADAAADSRHQNDAPRQGQRVAAGRADRPCGAAGTAGAARSGGGVSVMSVGGHAGECRRTVLTYGGGRVFLPSGDIPRGRVPLPPGRDSPRVRGQDSGPPPRQASLAVLGGPRTLWDVPDRVDCPRWFEERVQWRARREDPGESAS